MAIERYPSERPRIDILDALWRTFSSPKFAATWLAVIVAATAVGSLFPQAPLETQVNPVTYNRWLSQLAPLYRSQAALLKRVGAFSIYRAVWYRALWGVFAFSLAVVIAEMSSAWWRERSWAVPAEPPAWGALWGQFTVASPLAAVIATLPVALGEQDSIVTARGEGHTHFVAERAVEARWAILLLHVGAVLALVGIFLGGQFGWREPELIIGQGDSVSVGHDTELVMRLDAVSPPAAPAEACASQLLLLAEQNAPIRGAPTSSLASRNVAPAVAAGWAKPSAPLSYRGISFLQQECGPAVQVAVIDAAGQRLLLRASTMDTRPRKTVNLIFREQEELYFLVPAQNTSVHVRLFKSPETGDASFFVRVYQGEETVFEGAIQSRDSVEIGAARYAFEGGHYAVLQAVYAPAVPLVALGLVLICLGSLGTAIWFWAPPYRIWGRLTELPDKVHVQVVSAWYGHQHEARFYEWMERLQERIEGVGA